MAQGIMVAATRQHVGKTTTCLALMSGLRKRLGKNVGFQKPVGQTHVLVKDDQDSSSSQGLKVDKDVRLFKEFFNINTCSYLDMSPVVIPKGYTRRFLDGYIREEEQINAIKTGFQRIAERNPFSVVEGTGHCGVGSIVNLDNARVASILGLDMVLVVNGGLGSAFDELALNRLMCLHNNVNIKGVLLNKVQPSKTGMIAEYFGKALKRWDIPLLGVVPDAEVLGRCTMTDYENLFKQKMISGNQESALWHYDNTSLVAMNLNVFMQKLAEERHSKTLFVTHASRSDLILGFLMHKDVHEEYWGKAWRAGLILAGQAKHCPDQSLMSAIQKQNQPVLMSGKNTYETMLSITNYTAKLNPLDINRTIAAVDHYEEYIDFDTILA